MQAVASQRTRQEREQLEQRALRGCLWFPHRPLALRVETTLFKLYLNHEISSECECDATESVEWLEWRNVYPGSKRSLANGQQSANGSQGWQGGAEMGWW